MLSGNKQLKHTLFMGVLTVCLVVVVGSIVIMARVYTRPKDKTIDDIIFNPMYLRIIAAKDAGDYNLALQHAEKMIADETFSASYSAYEAAGYAAAELGDMDLACSYLRKAVERVDTDPFLVAPTTPTRAIKRQIMVKMQEIGCPATSGPGNEQ